MLTRKHFNAIAEIIRMDKGMYSDGEHMRQLIGRELASLCLQENPRFDHARFLTACDIDTSLQPERPNVHEVMRELRLQND